MLNVRKISLGILLTRPSLKLDTLIFRLYHAYTHGLKSRRLEFVDVGKPVDPTSRWCLPAEPKVRMLNVRKISLGILLTKLSFEALYFRPYQAYTHGLKSRSLPWDFAGNS